MSARVSWILFGVIDQKFSVLNRSPDLLKSKKGPSPEQNELSLESLQVSNQIAGVLNSMEAEENALLRSPKQVSTPTLSQVRLALTAAFGTAVLILILYLLPTHHRTARP